MPIFYVPPRLACWGDSLTLGMTPYFGTAMSGTHRPENYGVGGNTSTQIATRFAAASAEIKALPTLLWAGNNDPQDPTTVLVNIATIIAGLAPGTDYLVLGLVNGDNGSSYYAGGAIYNHIVTINATLAELYGARFFDVRRFLIDRPNGSAQDALDVTRDIVPSSWRVDTIHLTAAGYAALAIEIAATVRGRFTPNTSALLDVPIYPVSASPFNRLGLGTSAPIALMHVDANSGVGALVVSNAALTANPFLGIGISGGVGGIITGDALGDVCFLGNTSGHIRFSANNGGTSHLAIRNDGGVELATVLDLPVISTPSAPSAGARVYCDQSGGKNRLMVIFPSGAAQVAATQP